MARPAHSLLVIRDQVNKFAPHRDKASDGIYGDAAHAKLGSGSDHNPWYKDIVTAIDIDHDPKGGFNCDDLAKALVYSGDPRVKYIIFNAQIYRNYPHTYGYKWVKYTGLNAHKTHLHLSVVASVLCDDDHLWNLWVFRNLKMGCWNDEVKRVQERLNVLIPTRLVVDGMFGPKTDFATKTFQKMRGLSVDGIVGQFTKLALGI
ncbi:MAG: peptidoglycan-binding protein [Hyphomicrobiaceae bacterium]